MSNMGNVRSLDRRINGQLTKGKILIPNTRCGYAQICLYRNGVSRKFYVHRLVYFMFHPEDSIDNHEKEINHKDLNKLNNYLDNLELVTKSENQRHQRIHHHTQKVKKFCSNCGKELSQGTKGNLCKDCILSQNTCPVSKEELLVLVKEKTLTELSNLFDTSKHTIKKWCELYQFSYTRRNKKGKIKKDKTVCKIPVKQIDAKTGEVISVHKSISDANKSLGKDTDVCHIGEVCKGKRKSAYGYKWEYA